MKRRFISSRAARDTARILAPADVCLSPVHGLLIQASGCFLANLRQQAKAPAALLAREVFYQRNQSGKRYGPVKATTSQSSAIQWLSIQEIGQIVGFSVHERVLEKPYSNLEIDRFLKGLGVECNRKDGKWTGVSLERFRRIIVLLSKDYAQLMYCGSSLVAGHTLPVVQRLVWERAESKMDLLKFLLSVETAAERQILRNEFSFLRQVRPCKNSSEQAKEDEKNVKRWESSSFLRSELNEAVVNEAVNVLLQRPPHPGKSNGMCLGEAIEIIAASLSMDRTVKPAIKLSKFGYDGGSPKPDCVEVVLREILDGLLFDPENNAFDDGQLPPTSSGLLREFYKSLRGIDIDSHGKSQYGQAWFELCSDLNAPLESGETGITYLSTTSNGKEYELKPCIATVSAALGILLQGCDNERNKPPWRSLRDLQEFWNHSSSRYHIAVSEQIQRFRAPFSDTEMITREQAEIQIPHRNLILSVELEAAHNLATVRHGVLKEVGNLWQGEPNLSNVLNHWLDSSSTEQTIICPPSFKLGLSLLQCVLLQGTSLERLSRGKTSENDVYLHISKFNQIDLALLSSPWGFERLHGFKSIGVDGSISATDANIVSTQLSDRVNACWNDWVKAAGLLLDWLVETRRILSDNSCEKVPLLSQKDMEHLNSQFQTGISRLQWMGLELPWGEKLADGSSYFPSPRLLAVSWRTLNVNWLNIWEIVEAERWHSGGSKRLKAPSLEVETSIAAILLGENANDMLRRSFVVCALAMILGKRWCWNNPGRVFRRLTLGDSAKLLRFLLIN